MALLHRGSVLQARSSPMPFDSWPEQDTPEPQPPPHSHALRIGRFSQAGMPYFLTSNVDGRKPLLDNIARETVIESLLWARAQGRIWLLGYMILDDHFHTLIILRDQATLALFTDGLKRHTARQINKRLGQTGTFWQESYHDHAIRDESDLWHHVHYMHANPVRRGWVGKPEDYSWSSAHASRLADLDWDKVGYSESQ